MRYKKKVYGSYKISTCPFCSRTATSKNEQGLDVCHQHTKSIMEESKCICGSWLELRQGKFGPYFHCEKCGNKNFSKGMEVIQSVKPTSFVEEEREGKEKQKNKFTDNKERKETTMTTDDVEYFS